MSDQSLSLERVYFTPGGSPKTWLYRAAVNTAPVCGYAMCLILRGEKRATILALSSLEAFTVPNKAGELHNTTVYDLEEPGMTEKIIACLNNSWTKYCELGMQKSYDTVAVILNMLGAEIPTQAPIAVHRPGKAIKKDKKGGKEAADTLTKPVKKTSKRGIVAAYFAKGDSQSLRACMAELEMSRSNVLTHLHGLHKDHGVGYELLNDTARLVLPADCDSFDSMWVPEK